MCEWLKQAVLKTAVRETVPGVRIPLPPPVISLIHRGFHFLRLFCSPSIPPIWGTQWGTFRGFSLRNSLLNGSPAIDQYAQKGSMSVMIP